MGTAARAQVLRSLSAHDGGLLESHRATGHSAVLGCAGNKPGAAVSVLGVAEHDDPELCFVEANGRQASTRGMDLRNWDELLTIVVSYMLANCVEDA